MSEYAPTYTKPYPDGWKDLPTKETPVTAEIMDAYDAAIKNIEDYLSENPISGGGGDVDLTNLVVGNSISLGRKADTTIGEGSVATGCNVIAYGVASHAEGLNTVAHEDYAHAEGFGTKASDQDAHAEGYYTVADGLHSHSEGCYSEANGESSHAEGDNTIASGDCQHVEGKFNIEDAESKYAHIVGGGTTDSDRKNIHTLDWQGNAEYAGTVKSAGLKLTDTATGQEYMLTMVDGNLKIAPA